MPRVYSSSGCLTCFSRKKKCDEAIPKCGDCTRLGFVCVKRTDCSSRTRSVLKATNRKMGVPTLQVPVSCGHPAFENDLEKYLVIESPSILNHLLSPLTRANFRNIDLLGRIYTQSRLAREAMMAFSAYGRGLRGGNSYQVSLRCYQSCIVKLRQNGVHKTDGIEADYALTAILFLGLLEALTLGDTSNALVHFEMCKKLLISRLARPEVKGNRNLMDLYRIAAECIMYNIGALSTFQSNIEDIVTDWGTAFDCLFSDSDHNHSPFLDGFSEVYQVMLKINTSLYRIQRTGRDETSMRTFDTIREQLKRLGERIPAMYFQQHANADITALARAKNTITVLSLQIHLAKVARPRAISQDADIQHYVAMAVDVLKHEGLQRPRNIDLRWPLTILACAANEDEVFRFLAGKMREMRRIVDLANGQKLATALTVIQTVRNRAVKGAFSDCDPMQGPFDLLLNPCALDNTDALSSPAMHPNVPAL